jgi:hypothetical protein
MKSANQFSDIRYDSRNKAQAGKYRGTGIPGKVGHKTTSKNKSDLSLSRGVPPLRFN